MNFDKLLERIEILKEKSSRCTKTTKKAHSTRKGKKWMKCVKSGSGYKRLVHIFE